MFLTMLRAYMSSHSSFILPLLLVTLGPEPPSSKPPYVTLLSLLPRALHPLPEFGELSDNLLSIISY